MNTQGWVRGLIAYNSPLDKFIDFVCNTISKEFEVKLELIKKDDIYIFNFDCYKVKVTAQELLSLQKKGPYELDKYLLESLKSQGVEFNVNRSQYVQYCYGILEN